MRSSNEGSTLLLVMIFLMLGSALIGGLFFKIESNAATTGSSFTKKRAFFLAEGVTRIASKLTQDYLSQTAAPTTAGLSAYVASKTAGLAFDFDLIEKLTVRITGTPGTAPVVNGAFAGMDAFQVPIEIDVLMRDRSAGTGSEVLQTSTLAKVGMFQFSLFSDLPSGNTYLVPGMPMDVRGRIHVNGNFCYGNFGSISNPVRIENLTASGWVRNIRETTCWNNGPVSGTDMSMISTGSNFTTFAELKPGAGNGCVNCDLTGLSWRDYALATWRNNVMDMAHSVQKLRFSLQANNDVQYGALADLTPVSNAGSSRVLVDPVLPTDSLDARSQKLAYKADIRIINGVWYLKNPSNPDVWPGVPIWSDHPGKFVTTGEEGIEGALAVGQEDIRQQWQFTPTPWPAGVPTRYSYYEYDPAAQSILADGSGVVSYGTVYRAGGAPVRWSPGHWARSGSTEFCDLLTSCTNCSDSVPLNALALGSITCNAGTQPGIPDFLLNATRSGFRDGHVASVSAPPASDRVGRSKILPMNFDLAAFHAALASTAAGELGSYFGSGRFMGREFNGLLYITNTWPGALAGIATGQAQDYPFQGAQADPSQVTASHPAQQQALPFALCSSAAADLVGGLAGDPLAGPAGHFRIPDCRKYSPSYTAPDRIQARPNVIRVLNSDRIDPALLPKGLTIATNLPAYLMGDYNSTSDTTSQSATPWAPALVAADQVMLLSNAWNDALSRWDQAPGAFNRLATDTVYNLSLLSGVAGTTTTAWSGGLENLPRFLEQWNYSGITRTATVRGSLVAGFFSVYFRNPIGPSVPAAVWGPTTYLPPRRDYGFDDHLKLYINQPPGAPVFDIYSLRSWNAQ
jgi:hypothetical protein